MLNNFSDNFFQDETREGFLVEAEMKHMCRKRDYVLCGQRHLAGGCPA